jgi:hypothetical protein
VEKWWDDVVRENAEIAAPLTHYSPQIPLELAWGRHLGRLGGRSATYHLRRSVHQLSQNDIRTGGQICAKLDPNTRLFCLRTVRES